MASPELGVYWPQGVPLVLEEDSLAQLGVRAVQLGKERVPALASGCFGSVPSGQALGRPLALRQSQKALSVWALMRQVAL